MTAPTTRETADHAELKRLAEAATPGPWYRGHNENGCAQGEMSVWPDAKMIGAIIAQCGHQAPWAGWFEQPAKDAAFIATANPATVLALLSEIAALRGERDRIAGESIWWKGVIGDASHQPSGDVRSIKHMHPAMVKPIYDAHKGTAVADVIAGLIFSLAIAQNREQFLVKHANDRATQAARQRDELRKALEPFAEAAESLDDETRDHDHIWEQPAAMSIDAGHLRTARALLANQGAE